MGDRIVVIDGNSLINRAYYAMQRPMITKEGIYTQGIFGFLNMLSKIMEDYDPQYIAVAFDKKAPTFRHNEYKEYKAGRKKMPIELAMEMPILKEILCSMNIKILEIEGFEADDIIGTIARLAEDESLEPLIITGDKDALQLATEKTHILITKKGISEFDIYDDKKMIERYNLTPKQFIDLKGLMGDQSDNIPGIPGVGEKTGIKLLEQFGNMENMFANVNEIKNEKLRQKVEENIQLAMMSKRLATIEKYVPIDINLEECKIQQPNYDKLIDLYVKLEFNSFLKKLHLNNLDTISVETKEDNIKYDRILITSEKELDAIKLLKNDKPVTIKVFTDHNHIKCPTIRAIAFTQEDKYFYIKAINETLIKNAINLFNKINFEYNGHDIKNDIFSLMFYGLENFKLKFDTAIAGYVIDPTKSNYDIKTLVFEMLHYELSDEKSFNEANGQLNLFDDGSEKYMEYGFNWCQAVNKLKQLQEAVLAKNDLSEVFYKVEMPLIEVLAAMEYEGITVNYETLEILGKKLSEELGLLEIKIHEYAEKDFNINSPSQLGEILFETLKLPAGKKTTRGYSTSVDVLNKIKDLHPIVNEILRYRTLAKLNSTYVEGLKPLIGSDKKVRAHFQQTVTATGRISCTEPNLQNIPIRQELGRQLRKAFVSGNDEFTLIGADYSQIELRVLAHLSGDENLIKAFNNGEDIHRLTAAKVLGIDYDKVTNEERNKAKVVNFGVIYGMSGFGLSEELKITRKEAENYIKEYFNKYIDVKAYMDSQVESCKKLGYSTTITGRKRVIHEINSSNYMVRQLGERLAMNSPIQGTAADIIKIAMIKVYNELKIKHPNSKLILQVHDELIIKVDKSELELVKKLLQKNMEEAMNLKVKLSCEMNEGDSWFDLK